MTDAERAGFLDSERSRYLFGLTLGFGWLLGASLAVTAVDSHIAMSLPKGLLAALPRAVTTALLWTLLLYLPAVALVRSYGGPPRRRVLLAVLASLLGTLVSAASVGAAGGLGAIWWPLQDGLVIGLGAVIALESASFRRRASSSVQRA